jgi:hypothetical protein
MKLKIPSPVLSGCNRISLLWICKEKIEESSICRKMCKDNEVQSHRVKDARSNDESYHSCSVLSLNKHSTPYLSK